MDLKVKYLVDIEEDKKHHLWHGGDVAEIQVFDNLKFVIAAYGDVICDIYEKDEYVNKVKDKYNNAVFSDIVSSYIDNDKELEKYITYDYITNDYFKEIKKEGSLKDYTISFCNNNWWECYAEVNGEPIDLMWSLDATYIDEAINEVIEEINSNNSDFLKSIIE